MGYYRFTLSSLDQRTLTQLHRIHNDCCVKCLSKLEKVIVIGVEMLNFNQNLGLDVNEKCLNFKCVRKKNEITN